MNTPQAPMTLLKYLESLSCLQIAEDPKVKEKFIEIYNAVHGKGGLEHYTQERTYFVNAIRESKDLMNCTKLSVYESFIEMAMNGLSLDPQRKLASIYKRGVNLGTKTAPNWENRCRVLISCYGELALRMLTGQVRYADNPVIVYDGDTFSFGMVNNQKTVNYQMNIPRKPGAAIIASFIKIVRNDGSVDFGYLLPDDVERLKGFSSRQNNGTANALYSANGGKIDPGFLEAKTIKHAFDSYPKIRMSDIAELEGEIKNEFREADPAPINNASDPFNPELEKKAETVETPSITISGSDDEPF